MLRRRELILGAASAALVRPAIAHYRLGSCEEWDFVRFCPLPERPYNSDLVHVPVGARFALGLTRRTIAGSASLTNSIGSNAGRTYSTPEAWIAAANGTTIPYNASNPQPYVGLMYKDSLFTTAGIVFAGITTTAWTGSGLPAIILTTAPGVNSFRDNPNVRTTNALTYNPANGVAISCPLASLNGRMLTADIPNLAISNIQFQCTNGNRVFNTDDAGGSPPIYLDNCIINGNTPSDWVCALGSVATNSLFEQTANIPSVNGSGTIFDGAVSISGAAFRYCTLVQYSDTPPSDVQIWNTVGEGGQNTVLTNTALFGCNQVVQSVFTPPPLRWAVTCTTSMTDAPFLPPSPGAPGLTINVPYTAQFLGTSSSTRDFRLSSGSVLRGAGTAVPGVTTDISGFPRPSVNPDVGCWQFA